MRKKTLLFLLPLLLINKLVLAQDHLYSQFYNAPNYLNPALNGQFNGDLRINMIYRNQWTGLTGGLTYSTFSLDYTVPKLNGGIGLMVTKASEGVAYLNKTSVSGIYSYSVTTNNTVLSFGLLAGITGRKIDSDKLVFSDQIDPVAGIVPGLTSGSSAIGYTKYYFDAGAGLNLVSGNLMIGASAQHLDKPDESFTGVKSELPMRLNANISYKINIDRYSYDDDHAIIPSVVYYTQAKSRTYSAGAQYKYRGFNLGLWYRSYGKANNAVVLTLLLDLFSNRDTYDKLRVGVSHDSSVTGISYGQAGGSTEGALNYEITFPNRGAVPNQHVGNRCYDFY